MITLGALIARVRAGSPVDSAEVLPLLEDLQRRLVDPDQETRIVGAAYLIARAWRDQCGINGAMLDQLAVEVLDAG